MASIDGGKSGIADFKTYEREGDYFIATLHKNHKLRIYADYIKTKTI